MKMFKNLIKFLLLLSTFVPSLEIDNFKLLPFKSFIADGFSELAKLEW